MRTTPLLASLAALAFGCDGMIADPAASGPGGTRGTTVRPDDPAYCELADPDPGPVTLRRLNQLEYNNTVRDLFGDTTRPADAFPEDDVSGDGFDNNGAILSIGDLHMEKYDAAAREVVGRALGAGVVADRYMACDPAADEAGCARSTIRDFGLRAWRRPLESAEVERLGGLFDGARAEGESFDGALALAMRAMLISPHFLFHVERDGGDAARALDAYELASRLSYFLWSTMPDDGLFESAAGGTLTSRDELAAQVDRMLADPKADSFYESFVGQWLSLRDIEYATPNAELFPQWDAALRDALALETIEVVRYVIESNAPVGDLLTGRYSFLNERLAEHYGIGGVTGDAMQRVELAGTERGGILTHGSILTVTSHPDETSPVTRGKWVLEQILCAPPPDPPADVDTFLGGRDTDESLRARLERHRADPACATCHDIMDPIGFGLEAYDPIGQFRTEYDDGFVVDDAGELPDGTTFEGAQELAAVLEQDDRYVECVTEKMMAYALGRGVVGADRCFVEEVIEEAQRQDMSLREIIVQIVTNEVFTMVGGEVAR
jgi:hypothetical protein